ncbi:hypothetical protein L596_027723 [Steinernema carpocapsae]|uniref:Uncharacterized protein n=1 Tax=Steinernema carpocapsae TaxID=34508 RepID=A0A4U5LWB6_STECR|nr:hypothetical protein L596_027723 [Steinernema carpocapsae]
MAMGSASSGVGFASFRSGWMRKERFRSDQKRLSVFACSPANSNKSTFHSWGIESAKKFIFLSRAPFGPFHSLSLLLRAS